MVMGKSTLGQPRLLTDAQVQEILEWHERFRALSERRHASKSKRQLAAALGLTLHDIDHIIAHADTEAPAPQGTRRRGRPPKTHSPAVRACVQAWYAQRVELNRLRERLGTVKHIAIKFHVSPSVIWRILNTGGAYKQVSPERRDEEVARRRRRLALLRERNLA
ncbi:MAG TPA: hypothetical protein VG963_11060 [Polyangiaceae bacterium]|nr:hypothetical protein [Polyangiaceae bacterium]